MLGILAVVVVFSFVILVHEFGHFIAARRIGVRVEKFSLGFGKALWSRKRGETEYSINAVPFGGYIKMAGEEPSDKPSKKPWEFCAKPVGKRFWIIVAGAFINYILAFVIFCFVAPTSRIGVIITDMPAYKAGMKTGDRIASINGEKVLYWYEVLNIISSDKSVKPLKMQIERDKQIFELTVTPQILKKSPKIGIGPGGDIEFLKANPIKRLWLGTRQTLDNTLLTYRFIGYLVTGKVSIRHSVTGPIGIAMILHQAVKIGLWYLIYLVAHINLALAIFNLLPFPVLDGGHIMFLGLEKIMKRPLGVKTQEVIQYGAIAMLIAFAIFVSYNDIINFIRIR